MGLRSLHIFYFFQCEDRLLTSQSDVYRRHILTSEDGPRAERVNIPLYVMQIVLYTRDCHFMSI